MNFADDILAVVEAFVNGLFSALNSLFDALGIPVDLQPIDI